MIRIIAAYLATAVAFAAVDAVWLTQSGALYRPALDAVLRPPEDPLNLPAAVVFYVVYIAGIIANKDGQALEIGGVEDHIHLLTSCSPRIALADFIRDVKANSSKWLREERGRELFQWQTGYSAFTVSGSQVKIVRRYVRNQVEHHRKQSFEEEYRTLLLRHGIKFDERYLFDEEHHA